MVVAVALICAVFAMMAYEIFSLRRIIVKLRYRNPVEIDLELATQAQIMAELRKRPLQYMFIVPQFNGGENINAVMVEASGLSPESAKHLITKACSVMCGNKGKWFKG